MDDLQFVRDAERRINEMCAESVRTEQRHAMRMAWAKLGTDFMVAGDTFALACALNPNPGALAIGQRHRARMYELAERAFENAAR